MTIVKRANGSYPTYGGLLNDFLTRDFFDWPKPGYNYTPPKVNISETNDDFIVEMAAPGYQKNDFSVSLENNQLTITAEKEEASDQEINYLSREFNFMAFSRSFILPEMVQADKINAKYTEGILRLTVPKKEEAKRKPALKINIA